ncbi:S8 family peptidase [uncultured Brevundimonas sp.]|uniref:S8 family peptidase n=1 Tax=uncultured Brevundimonas sp. TaxID=213418 RepID=UPI002631957F|nr:S8 family peptidase [uncultured Brevundimonas sp.]
MADSQNALHNLKHVRIEARRRTGAYTPPNRDLSGMVTARDHQAHGTKLAQAIATAIATGRAALPAAAEVVSGKKGVYLEIEAREGDRLPDLTWSRADIRQGAVRTTDEGVEVGVLYVPLQSTDFLMETVGKYAASPAGSNASNRGKFDSLETVRSAEIGSLWTDPRPFPPEETAIWWECWCWRDRAVNLRQAAKRLDLRVSERRLLFPDYEVVPVFGVASQMQRLLRICDAVEELRRAEDSPVVFMSDLRGEQPEWTDDLSGRLIAPAQGHPSVCILDSGVAYLHPLIEPSLSLLDLHAIDTAWAIDDHNGHGTQMAGVALYGDLTFSLASSGPVDLAYGIESVKILPPPGFSDHEPGTYGSITQAAVSLPEIANPGRHRVFCMAVSNEDISGERPSTWSAALDQICAGAMPGDETPGESRRLFVVSAGNIQDSSDPDEISDYDEFPVEDPAQAWNALSVGGFTDKVDIQDKGYETWKAVAGVGDSSPYSRTSADWSQSLSPIKPEVVFEAGNRALNAAGSEILAGLDSLSLLTTARDFTSQPLTTIWATSPAAAQAAGFAGAIMAADPALWPETVRALMVHSAEWTPRMQTRLKACKGKKKDCISEIRRFGYGVPQLERALASARNDVALLAEAEIQPYHRVRKFDDNGKTTLAAPSLNETHYYRLPWPKSALEALGSEQVRLKIVLSYFIEPGPGDLAAVVPARYQSFGLRWDLKRPLEGDRDFIRRFNGAERVKDEPRREADIDKGWTLGPQSIAAGSLHCDVWTGAAAELAARDLIAIYPVAGWWKTRAGLRQYDRKARYALIVSISTDAETVDLHAEVEIANQTPVEIEF